MPHYVETRWEIRVGRKSKCCDPQRIATENVNAVAFFLINAWRILMKMYEWFTNTNKINSRLTGGIKVEQHSVACLLDTPGGLIQQSCNKASTLMKPFHCMMGWRRRFVVLLHWRHSTGEQAVKGNAIALKGADILTPSTTLLLFFFISGVWEKPNAQGHTHSRVCC